ncbi:MAG: cob(I)yrinic acid a,c-diamide adenosyltransferase [Gloeomargarita sp. SKYG116]|nr:cob(I)yrinic acid a,c-diamide adenosyltransferase [Gloeomargarita sp. SKYG116]MCS7226095.1 cob(I)yrinic acid a,c-diamide adenosyltransferase [Gloeomargarita sp. SKYB31]MDW8400787.1 cob(I)yrinic acid a,c-diamide adenosyltransferase [Gloeomargarita sp. SKYGB_i_bin116]
MLSPEQYRRKMQQRQRVQMQYLERCTQKGLVIIYTGDGKGKTTAALGMVLRSLGHGYRVAVVQFIKGAWEPAERRVLEHWSDQIRWHALGEGFTWETQDWERDRQCAQNAWQVACEYLRNPNYYLTVLDEVNVALRLGYLEVEQVLRELQQKPAHTHVVLTGRGAPPALIDYADLVTEMTLLKHPFRSQGIKAQPGIEY